MKPQKFSLLFLLTATTLASSVSVLGTTPSENDLGKVMYVGDSITHGVNSASYRWAMHKIFVDNGISYDGIGYKTGHHSGGVSVGASYGGVPFSNEHSAQSSARAWEIAGRSSGGRFDNTNIRNWLGLSDTKTNGGAYTGKTFDVDTFFLLIGTNDLLSDSGVISEESVLSSKTTNLLGSDFKSGDMGTIVDAMYQSNVNAAVTVLSIPCWTTHGNSNAEGYHAAIVTYNNNLKTWVSNYNEANGTNIQYVDVNKGIIDVASTTSFYGCSSMFNNPGTDGLHPNAQGDLLIAGNLAKSLGYAGRTAGQRRKSASEFAVNISNFNDAGTHSTTNTSVSDGKLDFSASGESTLVADWASDADLSKGFTIDFDLILGNGAADGWDTSTNFSVSVGDASRYGVLNINEAYIQWGNMVLYSDDMSKNADDIRVAYVVGNAAEGLTGGFYVWLGDMLIGEALNGTSGTDKSGVTFSYSGTGTAVLGRFSMDGTGSYAPTTTLFENAATAYLASDPNYIPTAPAQGEITFATTFTQSATDLTASGTYVARAQADSSTGSEVSVVGVTIVASTATIIYANSGNYTGDVWVTVTGGETDHWYGAHSENNLTGDVGLRLTGDCTGGSTVFGAVNAGTVYGNVYVDISAENSEFDISFTNTNKASLVGAYNASIAGAFHAQISAGTFNYAVMGGLHHADGGQTVGQTKIFINGGTLKSGVYGGGIAGTIGNPAISPVMLLSGEATASEPATSVVVTSGIIEGGVYGGGSGDTINGDVSVAVTGGTISGGIYGGGTSGTISGNTSVTIEGNIPRLRVASAGEWSDISGGGTGGTIEGNSTVTLKNVTAGNDSLGFDKYAGLISGGTNVAGTKTLVLDGVVLSSFGATLSDFDAVSAINGTQIGTAISSLGGASLLSMEAGTSLIISDAADLSGLAEIELGVGAFLALDFSTLGGEVVIETDSASTEIMALNGAADMDLSGVKFLLDGALYDAKTVIPDLQAGTVFVTAVPEPSAFALLAGLGALALVGARRRRK